MSSTDLSAVQPLRRLAAQLAMFVPAVLAFLPWSTEWAETPYGFAHVKASGVASIEGLLVLVGSVAVIVLLQVGFPSWLTAAFAGLVAAAGGIRLADLRGLVDPASDGIVRPEFSVVEVDSSALGLVILACVAAAAVLAVDAVLDRYGKPDQAGTEGAAA